MSNEDQKKKTGSSKSESVSTKPDAKPLQTDEDEKGEDSDQLVPVRPKIGEGPDNLQRREDWFQKRSGRG